MNECSNEVAIKVAFIFLGKRSCVKIKRSYIHYFGINKSLLLAVFNILMCNCLLLRPLLPPRLSFLMRKGKVASIVCRFLVAESRTTMLRRYLSHHATTNREEQGQSCAKKTVIGRDIYRRQPCCFLVLPE
jgi:hypothetical protein